MCLQVTLNDVSHKNKKKTTLSFNTLDHMVKKIDEIQKIETASINLFLRSKDFEEVRITNKKIGCKLLKFAVYDS